MSPFRFLAVVLVAVPLFAAADPIPQIFSDYTNLRVGAAVELSKVNWTWSHLRVDGGRVSAAPVFAGAAPVGVFLKGAGRVEYRSSDPVEQPVALTNLKASTKLRGEKEGSDRVVRDSFDEALILAAGPVPLPKVEGASAAPLTDAFAKHLSFFSRDQGPPVAHAFIAHRIDQPATPLVQAQFSGYGDAGVNSSSLQRIGQTAPAARRAFRLC